MSKIQWLHSSGCFSLAPQDDSNHRSTLILLHGRGSNAEEFAREFLETQDSYGQFLYQLLPETKVVFPEANVLPSEQMGIGLHQWFDMYSTANPHEHENEQLSALLGSANRIVSIIHEEARIVGYQHIILGGISQGCATAVYALLGLNRQLGGFVGFAGWLPLPAYTLEQYAQATEALHTPALLEHCDDDAIIAMRYGEELHVNLEALGIKVEWKAYGDGDHWINEPKGFEDFVEFVKTCLHAGSVIPKLDG
ncbi:hypothetical protein BAUCODRAFT_548505 [Baudoinia panamericana UAMH 10762]|uniref:Phospholipase/carboxylesterase/thioesterase domain-containing protein n=1 Tax=Baudoinia panamericana (strain UAMH 10762) TaxID=717646 RepID=M2LJP1_BAUPA|nr:uncharacterized protein BAUCODRAFT_548505 [Baudoinia panamericana UAMH 10762]EMC94442.1 hypothetical protein BAUCODRAFT_548505 [Baudoinia panamericana UAMH 10762]